MASIRATGTTPEARLEHLLRSLLPRRKIVAHPAGLTGKPDFLVSSLNLVAFADGCFWHGCPKHGRVPEDNRDYWEPKLQRNRARDRRVARELRAQGFVVVRIWDHELKDGSAARRKINRALASAVKARA